MLFQLQYFILTKFELDSYNLYEYFLSYSGLEVRSQNNVCIIIKLEIYVTTTWRKIPPGWFGLEYISLNQPDHYTVPGLTLFKESKPIIEPGRENYWSNTFHPQPQTHYIKL